MPTLDAMINLGLIKIITTKIHVLKLSNTRVGGALCSFALNTSASSSYLGNR